MKLEALLTEIKGFEDQLTQHSCLSRCNCSSLFQPAQSPFAHSSFKRLHAARIKGIKLIDEIAKRLCHRPHVNGTKRKRLKPKKPTKIRFFIRYDTHQIFNADAPFTWPVDSRFIGNNIPRRKFEFVRSRRNRNRRLVHIEHIANAVPRPMPKIVAGIEEPAALLTAPDRASWQLFSSFEKHRELIDVLFRGEQAAVLSCSSHPRI